MTESGAKLTETPGDAVWISARGQSLAALLNPLGAWINLWVHRYLIWQFAKREILGRYKGSKLGLFWSAINPLLMLTVYTFVFSVVFKARWNVNTTESKSEFALTMFCGLIVFNLFAECVSRAPLLIVGNPNFVKKVVFPLEILPVSVLLSSLLLSCVSLFILVAGIGILLHSVSPTMYCLPIVLIPIGLFTLGFGWLFASLGVYLRAVGHAITIALQGLLFMPPIFYPMSAVPQPFRSVMEFNPLGQAVEWGRMVLIWGMYPNWIQWGCITLLSVVVAQLGYAWFMKTKRGFADVL